MKTQNRLAVAAAASVDLADIESWESELGAVMGWLGRRFARAEPRERAGQFIRGLLGGLPRVNGWSIAEHAGQSDPHGMQRLLSQAAWDTAGATGDLRSYVAENLGAPDDQLGAVLVVDETGDVKKGTKTVGVQRQYSGTAGRIENCQIAVYLTFATARGYSLIDHALYLPESWTSDSQRMAAAGVPAETSFATKPVLAGQMIEQALDAGVTASWVAGDEVYGNAGPLRLTIAARGIGFVMAIAKTHPITTGIGTRTAIDYVHRPQGSSLRWHRYSAGDGAHGPRNYDWAWIDTTDPALTAASDDSSSSSSTAGSVDADQGGHDWLLIRRSIRTGELAFYRAHAPHPVSLKTLVRVAGSRWRVEDSFAGAKELAALDQHQVRTWTSWHRWSLLAMIAHAVLAILAARQPPPPDGLIALTRHEIRRLLAALTHVNHPPEHTLAWSIWRRDHQATARTSHYRRAALEP